MMRVGPRRNLVSRCAHHFAQSLLERAYSQNLAWRTIAFGSSALLFGQRLSDSTGVFIDGAFLPARSTSTAGTLAIARYEEVTLPSTAWAHPWIERGAEIPSAISYPYRIAFDRVRGLCYVLDQRNARAAVWLRQVPELDHRALVTPFRIMFSWLGNLSHRDIIHAAAVVIDAYGVALSGPSGSGKSTLALALGISGVPFIADDCLIVEGTSMYPLYSRAKVDEDSRQLLDLGDSVVTPVPGTSNAKWVVSLSRLGVPSLTSAPLDVWAFPKIARLLAWYPIGPRQAHRELIKDSFREVLGGSTGSRLRIARTIGPTRSFRLLLGPNATENVALISEIVSEGLLVGSGE